MKWINCSRSLTLALLWSFLLSQTVFIQTAFAGTSLSGAVCTYDGIYDMADLFTDEEERKLSQMAAELIEKMKMDLAVVTTEDAKGYTGQEFADHFYEDNGMGAGDDYSGALLAIDMDNREISVSTEGKMLRYMTDIRIETILDDVYEQVGDGNFYEGTQVFLKDAGICYDNGIASDQFNESSETGKISKYRHLIWYEILFALGVAAVCGFVAVAAVTRDYGMKGRNSNMAANFKLSYRSDSAFTLGSMLADVMIGSYVTHRIISTVKNNRGGSGGGFSGGGLSGGGRSTTHRSSSGRVHGGGSRKF